jgi:hypothetical protein
MLETLLFVARWADMKPTYIHVRAEASRRFVSAGAGGTVEWPNPRAQEARRGVEEQMVGVKTEVVGVKTEVKTEVEAVNTKQMQYCTPLVPPPSPVPLRGL